MHYNLEIRNEGALPVPYAITVGTAVKAVKSLYKDKELLCNAIFIRGTDAGQLRVHCVDHDVVLDLTPDVHIRYLPEVPKA